MALFGRLPTSSRVKNLAYPFNSRHEVGGAPRNKPPLPLCDCGSRVSARSSLAYAQAAIKNLPLDFAHSLPLCTPLERTNLH